MHPIIESVLDRPLGHKIAIWAVSLLAVFGIAWQFSLQGQFDSKSKLEEEVMHLDSDIATERRIASRLDKARDKLKDLEVRLKEALEQLPDKSEVDDLLDHISGTAREAGLELNLFQRKEDNVKEFYAEVPVSVSVTGSFHQVATFFDEVARLSRIVNISEIQATEPKITDSEVGIRVDCLLTAFRYLNDQERATAQATAEKKKRR
jgi:type IV pilus assembly protein PilO